MDPSRSDIANERQDEPTEKGTSSGISGPGCHSVAESLPRKHKIQGLNPRTSKKNKKEAQGETF